MCSHNNLFVCSKNDILDWILFTFKNKLEILKQCSEQCVAGNNIIETRQFFFSIKPTKKKLILFIHTCAICHYFKAARASAFIIIIATIKQYSFVYYT